MRRYYCHSRVSGEGGSGAGGQISGLREVIIPACHPHNQLLLAAHNFRYGFRVVHFLSAASRISKFLPPAPSCAAASGPHLPGYSQFPVSGLDVRLAARSLSVIVDVFRNFVGCYRQHICYAVHSQLWLKARAPPPSLGLEAGVPAVLLDPSTQRGTNEIGRKLTSLLLSLFVWFETWLEILSRAILLYTQTKHVIHTLKVTVGGRSQPYFQGIPRFSVVRTIFKLDITFLNLTHNVSDY